MTNDASQDELLEKVRSEFRDNGVPVVASSVRKFPGETIVVLEVSEDAFEKAIRLANQLDSLIPAGFITVKKTTRPVPHALSEDTVSLSDPRISALIELLNARSRTSEQQPSLKYVRDAAEWLRIAVSKRHHLIFGRRGVGKTALMLEAKRQVEAKGAQTLWINVQSIRSLTPEQAFLSIGARLCDLPAVFFESWKTAGKSVAVAAQLKTRVLAQLKEAAPSAQELGLIIAELQHLFNRFGIESSRDVYVFVDDVHYLAMSGQPKFLDMLHAISRDNAFWLKIAGIKHQTRWFSDNPPVGLQTTHDAAIINLDITLENPAKAKEFLTSILQTYAHEATISYLSSFISSSALERLVIGSGAAPRDFLLLCANSIQVARQRANARVTGVQDVNEAAGLAAKNKLQELEDDAASSFGGAQARLNCLNTIRTFLLEQSKATYFRVEFRDKEAHPGEYSLLQSLMDLRLIHLISSSLSDEHHAGRRFEVYALDLSQFSGSRLKYNLRTLDFSGGSLVLKFTGSKTPPRVGDTPKRLLGILRRGPHFPLDQLRPPAPA